MTNSHSNKLRKNIDKVLEASTDEEILKGTRWYHNANLLMRGLSMTYDTPLEVVCGVTAVMSCRTSWQENLARAERWLNGETAGHMGWVLEKCEAVEAAYYGTGSIAAAITDMPLTKTRCFYHNLLGHTEYVTLDRHALDLAEQGVPRPKPDYATVMNAYVQVGDQNGLEPCEIQAITWLAWRRMKGLVNYDMESDNGLV